MKSIIYKSALTVIMLVGAVCLCLAQNQTPQTIELRNQIDRLSEEIRTLELKENWMLWEKYIRHCEYIDKTMISIYGIRFSAETVWDTVPHLGDKRKEWEHYSDYINSKINKDRQYRRLKKKEIKAETQEERDKISKQVYMARDYVWYHKHPELGDIRNENEERLRILNLETAKFLLEYYKGIGEKMPTNIIHQNMQNDLQTEYFELEHIAKEIKRLKFLRNHLSEQLINAKYQD